MPQFRSVTSNSSAIKSVYSSFSSLKSLVISSCLLLTLAACGGGGSSASGNFDGTGSGGTGGTGGGTATPNPATYKIGTGSGASFQDGIISTSDADLDAGESTTLRVNVVTLSNDVPTTTFTVNFTSSCIATGLARLGAQTVVTPGLVSVPYTNNGCSGEDIVTARIVENGDTATVKLTLRAAQVISVAFARSTFDQLSLAGIGGNETAELTFKVTGAQGSAVAGKQVNFSVNTQAGGASILAGRETGITDQLGEVRTILKSGTIAGPVNVKAIHVETGRQGLSGDIIISTGVPEASRFSLSYAPFNPPNAFNNDGVTVTISVIASDTFGNNPPDGTRVSFVAPEGGNVQNSCLLVNGACSVNWRSTSPRPADLRVEVIAYTDGAEDFIDRNGNSVFDISDGRGPGQDLGEPFADEDENNAYNPGDYFFDTNRNGVWDAGNGLWDGPCLSKVDATAICIGNDTVVIYNTITIVMSTDTPRFLSLGNFPAPGSNIVLQQGASVSLSNMILADNNTAAISLGSNPLPLGTKIAFSIDGAGAKLQGFTSDNVLNSTSPTGPYGTTIVANPVVAPAVLPSGVRLLLNVDLPSGIKWQYSWPIIITN
jgi:hypothetical protein